MKYKCMFRLSAFAACLLLLAACGGGGGDNGGNTQETGTPSVAVWGYSRDNPSAEDLLDHWNDPHTLRTAMHLSPVSQQDAAERKRVLKALLDGADGNPKNAGVRFRNVRSEDIEIIGERNGITYAQWKAGPAGTLNIEFDYRLSSVLDSNVRAAIERAGKAWSYHIISDFGSYSIPAGVSIPAWVLDVTQDEAFSTNGLYVVVNLDEDLCGDGADACASLLLGDTRARLGLLWFTSRVPGFPGNPSRPNRYGADWTHQMEFTVHELGHILWGVEGFDRYINTASGTYDGPKAREANGGNSVPFRRYKEGEFFVNVPAGTSGAKVDYGHLGGCVDSVITYNDPSCSDGIELVTGNTALSIAPRTLDKAILADSGYEVLDTKEASEPEVYGFGAWGHYSAWGTGVQRTLRFAGDNVFHNTPIYEWDTLWARADAFGLAPAFPGLAQNPTLTGTVTWSGSLLGVDLGQDMLPPVFGDAELQVDLSTLDGTARFDNLTVFVENVPASFRRPSLEYAIDVTGNSFSDADSRLNGSFFGPAHEEMAGVLDDRAPAVNLLAAFGGKR